MTKPNKAPQGTIVPQMVDITKLHTPSGYARLKGCSRANVYLWVNNGVIPNDKVHRIDTFDGGEGQMLISE